MAFSVAFTTSFIVGIIFSLAFVRKHKVYQSNEGYLITARSSEFANSMTYTSITAILINSGGIALDKFLILIVDIMDVRNKNYSYLTNKIIMLLSNINFL